MKWSYDHDKSPKANMAAFLDEALAEDPVRSSGLMWQIYRDSVDETVPVGAQFERAFKLIFYAHPLRKALLPLSKEQKAAINKKTRAYRLANSELLSEEEINAPPPEPGHIPELAARRMASDIIRMAWDVASGNCKDTRMVTRGESEFTDLVGEVYRKYDIAWLQNPEATALWANILGIEPEMIAERSRAKHGSPRLTEQEKEALRLYIQHRKKTGSGEWRMR